MPSPIVTAVLSGLFGAVFTGAFGSWLQKQRLNEEERVRSADRLRARCEELYGLVASSSHVVEDLFTKALKHIDKGEVNASLRRHAEIVQYLNRIGFIIHVYFSEMGTQYEKLKTVTDVILQDIERARPGIRDSQEGSRSVAMQAVNDECGRLLTQLLHVMKRIER